VPTARRTFLGAAGVAAAACAATGRPAKAAGPSQQKLYVTSLTPCDKSLKFDDGLYKEMLPWFKTQGADGIVVLGTTGPMKYATSLTMGTRESYPRPPHLDATGEQTAQIKIKLKELGPIA